MLALFTLTVLLSAALLFLVQPMFARMVLPLLGGSPAVWNTALVFYQSTLLAGYAYTHFATRRLGVRRQAWLHLAIVLAALASLPIAVPRGWEPPTRHSPVPWMLGLLAAGIGLPFFVVSTTGPLLQRWFAATNHRSARDPYFLYAASNLGSMLGLLSYPIVVEPELRLADQSRLWTCGYALLALLIGGCAFAVMRSRMETKPGDGAQVSAEPEAGSPGSPAPEATRAGDALAPAAALPGAAAAGLGLTLARRLHWGLLAFVPSSLMLGVTTHITTDVAAIPLLWVIPLAIYLLSFILVFGGRSFVSRTLLVRALPLLILPLIFLMQARATQPLLLVITLHLLVLFAVAMTCHGELSRDRPATEHLTEFYLWLALGGALGGVFNALVAPVVFHSVAEYPIAIVLACLVMPSRDPLIGGRRARVLDFVVPAGFAGFAALVLMALEHYHLPIGPLVMATLFAALALPLYALAQRPLRFGLAVAALLLVNDRLVEHARVLYEQRSFFGVNRVMVDGSRRFHELIHGTTFHGVERIAPLACEEPLGYYHRSGPLGDVFHALRPEAPRRVAVTGLGAGSMAAYARPGESWTFYEIDPVVERIAADTSLFCFLSACPAQHRVVLGDARRSLAESQDRYDLMIFDAYSSDAIPVHLITREALELYLDRLAPRGVLVFHLSNRYFDLAPVVAALARDRGLACRLRRYGDGLTEHEVEEERKSPSTYAVLARAPEDLGTLASDTRWITPAVTRRLGLWTDDFSSLLSVLR